MTKLITEGKMNKVLITIVLGTLALTGSIFYSLKENDDVVHKNDKIIIDRKWELPESLTEISGMAFLRKNLIACVQDEDGVIFIYNLETSKITQEITFAGSGDYESITLVGKTAYVLRSDGTLYEITNFETENRSTREYTLALNAQYDFEGLGYDKKNNQLLLSIKDKSEKDHNPVFGFNLETKKMSENPVYTINFNDPLFSILDQKVSRKMLRPSEISVHPETAEIYVLEAVNPKLVILNPSGKPTRIYSLNDKEFRQAEGLTFGRNGELYISNEGNRAVPNILKISFEK